MSCMTCQIGTTSCGQVMLSAGSSLCARLPHNRAPDLRAGLNFLQTSPASHAENFMKFSSHCQNSKAHLISLASQPRQAIFDASIDLSSKLQLNLTGELRVSMLKVMHAH